MLKSNCFILLIILGIRLNVIGQDSRAGLFDHIFDSLYQSGKFSGNVLIAEKGKPIYLRSFGNADEENKRQIDSNSMFLLGSVSKQFTAFALVLLVHQGKLNLDDNIQKFIPTLPYQNITVRELLNHTSGVPDYISLMQAKWNKLKIASNNDMLDMLVQYHPPVLFEPGARYEYSNTGYALLALIIEKASGMTFGNFMEDQIFQPLGLNRTIVYSRRYKQRTVTDYALGYVYNDSLKTWVLPDSDAKWKSALWEDGIEGEDGINSTTDNMLKWDQALYFNPLLSAIELAEIFTPGKVQTGETDYGFGWHIKTFAGYGRIAFHSGGWPGYIAYIERHMDSYKTIIILRNRFSPETRMPIAEIRSILYSH
jgi:CubicO group peptidase (beta-lactamase class C family)